MNRLLRTLILSVIVIGAIAGMTCATAEFSSATQPACADACNYPATASCCGRAVACPKTNLAEEEKSCWIVKCEKVAVPAITLPWEQGGSPLTLFNCLRALTHPLSAKCNCAKCGGTLECCDSCDCCNACCLCGPQRCGTVRLVRSLDKEKYDVQKCETTWEIGCVPCCGNCGHCSHCCTQ